MGSGPHDGRADRAAPAEGNEGEEGFQSGTAEVVHSNAPKIREFGPQAVVVVSADAVYKLDYDALVDEHLDTGADVTMVTTEVESEDAGRYGVVQARRRPRAAGTSTSPTSRTGT